MDEKNQIKNILETHQKQYSLSVLIVSIVIALFVGIIAGYGIKSFIEAGRNAPNQVAQEKNYSAPYANEEENNAIQNEQPTEEKNAGNVNIEENNVPLSNNVNSNPAVQDNGSAANNENGPEIISPKINENNSEKIETKRINKTRIKRISVKHSKSKHYTPQYVPVKRKSNPTKYVIQVSSNLNRKVALNTLIKLRKYGFKAYAVHVNIHNKSYTRIMVGPVAGHKAAKFESNRIKKDLRLVYFPLIKKDD